MSQSLVVNVLGCQPRSMTFKSPQRTRVSYRFLLYVETMVMKSINTIIQRIHIYDLAKDNFFHLLPLFVSWLTFCVKTVFYIKPAIFFVNDSSFVCVEASCPHILPKAVGPLKLCFIQPMHICHHC